MRLSVVIPTWNKADLLAACLRSLNAQTRHADEIVVVDDGSTEDITGAVASVCPDARVVRLETNQGFCVAVNSGIRASSCESVLLLNNDMTLAPDCFEKLVQAAVQSPETILTPLILFQSEPDVIYAAGDRILCNGRPESIGFRAPRASFQFPREIFGATGGAALIPRSVFDRIGELDECFHAYFEDADFCIRARLAGFTCGLAADAEVFHIGSASLSGKTWWRSRQCFRNHALLLIKNFPLQVLLRELPGIAHERVHQATRLFSSARAEFGLLRALALLATTAASIMHALPHALRERARIRRTRVLTPDAFHALLSRDDPRS